MAGKYALLRLRADAPEIEPVTEINIIPVIDVSLVLLVILFVSAPLLSYPNLPIDLPHAFVPESQERTIAITYTAAGELAVGIDMVGWQGLEAGLREALKREPDATVVLRVDKSAPYQAVERLIAAAKEAGAKKTALGTEKPR